METITKSIGGDRLRSGNRMNVTMHGYGRSNHNLSRVWRSSMAPGTLVPCFVEPCLIGDTWDFDIDTLIKTLPTNGPLFGNFKFQIDFFEADDRLYNRMLHNNLGNVGMKMNQVLLPKIEVKGANPGSNYNGEDPNQINISSDSLLAYLGYRGIGQSNETDPEGTKSVTRRFNALPYLAYWEIYLNYYANRQEEVGYCIGIDEDALEPGFINTAWYFGDGAPQPNKYNLKTIANYTINIKEGDKIRFTGRNLSLPGIQIQTSPSTKKTLDTLAFNVIKNQADVIEVEATLETLELMSTIYQTVNEGVINTPGVSTNQYIDPNRPREISLIQFPLENIEETRNKIFEQPNTSPLVIDQSYPQPYLSNLGVNPAMNGKPGTSLSKWTMSGLAIKTYNSDRFNNWIKTDWIDGENGIAALSAVKIEDGMFTIDSLNLMQKVYNMMNRVAVSGGTYNDWMEVTSGMQLVYNPEVPIFKGGIHGIISFSEVTSTAEDEQDPLGTLAGKGFDREKSNGTFIIKAREHGYIIGIVSITPEIDYYQGNAWWVNLENMDQWHKPELSQIGYQELITEEMAAWDTAVNPDGTLVQKSAGKQTAWIQYQTATNQVYGNFAKEGEQMYMTLTRRYEIDNKRLLTIKDLTTYIDPTKFNYAFAQTDLNAQNFWVQIAIRVTPRRIMSAKAIPNL